MNNHRDYKLAIILLLLSATAIRGDYLNPQLVTLLEEGLVNSSDNLFNLRNVYFNPSYKYSPVSVCLQVVVIFDNITGLLPTYCFSEEDKTNYTDSWVFESAYVLQLSNDDRQLSDLLTTSGITGVFFTFDPTFYTIMKALASSFTPSYQGLVFNPNGFLDTEISMHLPQHLETFPCWYDVDEALRLVLVWVSKD